MAIIAIDGGLGAGKSYLGVMLLYDEFLLGRPVYSNSDVRFATRVATWEQVCSIRDGVFLWDEAHLDIDSRMFGSNVSTTPWLTQTRKLGVDIVYVTQNIDQVDIRLRRLTDVLIRCNKVSDDFGNRGTRFIVVELQPSPRIISDSTLAHSPFYYSLYDSYGLVLPLTGKIPSLESLFSR